MRKSAAAPTLTPSELAELAGALAASNLAEVLSEWPLPRAEAARSTLAAAVAPPPRAVVKFTLALDAELCAMLDAEASARGLSRATLIRRTLAASMGVL